MINYTTITSWERALEFLEDLSKSSLSTKVLIEIKPDIYSKSKIHFKMAPVDSDSEKILENFFMIGRGVDQDHFSQNGILFSRRTIISRLR